MSSQDDYNRRVCEAFSAGVRGANRLPAAAQPQPQPQPPDQDDGKLTAEEIEIVRAHLRSLAKQSCPKCDARSWSIGGLSAAPAWDRKANLLTYINVMPVVAVVCDECSYVEQYAWLPLLERARSGK